jgi:hypothetical protein
MDDGTRQPQCPRCTGEFQDEEMVVYAHRELFHASCWQALSAERLVRDAKAGIANARPGQGRGRAGPEDEVDAFSEDRALRHLRTAGSICAACLALECGASLEDARALLVALMNEGRILVIVEQCRYCRRDVAVARALDAPRAT